MQPLFDLKASLDAVDPRLFYAVLMVVVFLVVYGWRKLWPETFERIPAKWQSMPAVLLGAILSAASDSESVKQALIAALLGAVSSGLAAIGGHHALKAAPGPYGQKDREA